jgi:hypothetical protein
MQVHSPNCSHAVGYVDEVIALAYPLDVRLGFIGFTPMLVSIGCIQN